MSVTKAGKLGIIISTATTVLILILAAVMFLNRQFLSDSLVSFFFEPTPAVKAIEQRVGFTADGKRIFYATQPELSNANSFNAQCPRQEFQSPIIGCYTSDDRLYIYNVETKELDGIEEVTAAHEMLHAAWARLSDDERSRLSDLLEVAYTKHASKELRDRMDYYARAQPGEHYNELHSILPTEVAELGEELEAHYAKYFSDRQKVIELHDKYNKLYRELYATTEKLSSQMESLAKDISVMRSQYESRSFQLTADINSFNYRANSGSFTSMNQFNSERNSLLARSAQLERERSTLNAAIDKYNDLREKYIKAASKIEVLNKGLDSFQSVDKTPSL